MDKIGFENFHIILIKDFPCNNKEELYREKRNEIEKVDKNKSLNQFRPILFENEEKKIKKEYNEKNKEQIKKKEEYMKIIIN